MAQLRDTLILGSARVTDTLYANNVNIASTTASLPLFTDTSKNIITKSIADTKTALGIAASANHADSYFVKAITSVDNKIVRFDGNAGLIQTGPITISDEGYIRSYNTTRWTMDWYIFHPGANKLVAEVYFDSGDPTNITTGKFYWLQYSPTSTASNTPTSYREVYGLPTVTKDLTENKSYDILTSKYTVTVAQGGTGATTFTSGALLIGNGTNAVGTRTIKNMTTISDLGWTAQATDIYVPTINTLAYWNGRYNSSNSNLTYCNKGAFGDAVIYGVDDATANGALGTGTGLTTERSVYYGLVTVNNASQTRATGIYAPTSAGTANLILVSSGGTSAPTWKATANGAVYATSSNGALTFGTLPVAQGGTGVTSFTNDCVIVATGTTQTLVSRGLKVTGATNADITLEPNTSGKIMTVKLSSTATITYNSTNGCVEIIV